MGARHPESVRVLSLLRLGYTRREVSEKTGMCYSAVCINAAKSGEKFSYSRDTPERDAEIRAAHQRGESLSIIGKRFGITKQRVWSIVNRYRRKRPKNHRRPVVLGSI